MISTLQMGNQSAQRLRHLPKLHRAQVHLPLKTQLLPSHDAELQWQGLGSSLGAQPLPAKPATCVWRFHLNLILKWQGSKKESPRVVSFTAPREVGIEGGTISHLDDSTSQSWELSVSYKRDAFRAFVSNQYHIPKCPLEPVSLLPLGTSSGRGLQSLVIWLELGQISYMLILHNYILWYS